MIVQPLRILPVAWLLLAILWPQSGRAQEAKADEARPYWLVPKSAQRIKAVMLFEVKAPNVLADEWSIYVTQIPELPGQVDARTVLLPRGKTARDLSDEARPILYVKVPSLGEQWRKNIKARVEYEATLIERRLERPEPGALAPPPVAPLDAKSRRILLANAHQFDFNAPRFKTWLDQNQLRRASGEPEVDFARKAFLAVRQGFEHAEGADVAHAASKVCEVGKSDYVGLTAVFVAALRANGIPTRVLAGRMVMRDGQPLQRGWAHARAEFYANGIGWVPADPAGAIRSGRKTEGLEFFGNDNAELMTVHLGTDIAIDTYFGTKTYDTLQDPAWWVFGSGGGNFDGSTTKVEITVEAEPLELTEVLNRINARPAARKSATKATKKGG